MDFHYEMTPIHTKPSLSFSIERLLQPDHPLESYDDSVHANSNRLRDIVNVENKLKASHIEEHTQETTTLMTNNTLMKRIQSSFLYAKSEKTSNDILPSYHTESSMNLTGRLAGRVFFFNYILFFLYFFMINCWL